MNYIWLRLDAKPFAVPNGADRIKKLVLDLVRSTDAVYASAAHSQQEHDRIAQRTPAERLERMNWLTFFGEPYLQLFGGRHRVRKAPCYQVHDVPGGLLLVASPRPDSPEMTESNQRLLAIEEYLGADAFAGQGYPDVACRVPQSDLSETVNPST